ncbi:hypothetical protein [Ureibacillus sp. GCM10028918]|uniref:hypothetical protein n=1 Tax=Ureibacillus sp. GCM10028918 TaxID=3273429 RepID=UPI00360BEC22
MKTIRKKLVSSDTQNLSKKTILNLILADASIITIVYLLYWRARNPNSHQALIKPDQHVKIHEKIWLPDGFSLPYKQGYFNLAALFSDIESDI